MSTTSPSDEGTGTRRLPLLRDVDGTPVPFGVRVEQVAVDEEQGAFFSRLHQRGEVIGRDTPLLYVRFDRDQETIALRPELVRVLSTDGG
jgi:hypothetical protein